MPTNKTSREQNGGTPGTTTDGTAGAAAGTRAPTLAYISGISRCGSTLLSSGAIVLDEKWRKSLTPGDLEAVKAVAVPMGRRYGYDL